MIYHFTTRRIHFCVRVPSSLWREQPEAARTRSDRSWLKCGNTCIQWCCVSFLPDVSHCDRSTLQIATWSAGSHIGWQRCCVLERTGFKPSALSVMGCLIDEEPFTPPPLISRTATAPFGCGFAHTCCAPLPAGASADLR